MRTPPEHDRAMLHADTAALRDCAARLDALSDDGLLAAGGPEWNDVLAALAKRCRVAAAELERVAAAFFAVPGEVGEAGEVGEVGEVGKFGEAGQSPDWAGALALAFAVAGRLLAAPRAVADPLAPLIRRLPGGGHP
jgi:hypothetical protein